MDIDQRDTGQHPNAPTPAYQDTPRTEGEADTTLEEGSPCPENGCGGTLDLADPVGCSCHINPPCSACVDAGVECDTCGWRSYDPPEPEIYVPPKRMDRTGEFTSTRTSSPFNSTPFTRCCDTAAIGCERCPSCNAAITGHDDGLGARRREVGPGNCLMCAKPRGPIHIRGNCSC